MSEQFADKIEMQHRLFAELSRMFGAEVPLYDKSLLVNHECNRAVCALLERRFRGFRIDAQELERASGERHGAIRIGTADEYRLVSRFFAAFAMEPHNFYDMTKVGAKSQPVIATAFRSRANPEHRVFCSLLQTNYFDDVTRVRIESLLVRRRIFSDRARELLDRNERDGGLAWPDAEDLIREGTERIFRWTGAARDHGLYTDLCEAGFKIAADVACFQSHHLNHLTPNTLWMDLYTASMKFCLGEWDEARFRTRAGLVLGRLLRSADAAYLRLHFRHMGPEEIEALAPQDVPPAAIEAIVESLAARFEQPDLELHELDHSGFKEETEGPPEDTPVLLRQDSYKALTESVRFENEDGSIVDTEHTARFGEIEQRFYATTPLGRALYDACLASAEGETDRDPDLAERDLEGYEAILARHFGPFPKTLERLLERGLVYGRFEPTARGLAARGTIEAADVWTLVRAGLVRYEGIRYEDFLPVSAAGIFASNLEQYGTRSTAAVKPTYSQSLLEIAMERPIIDADTAYRAAQEESLRATFEALGLAPAAGGEVRPMACAT